jgi:hypothetical protein
LPTRVAGTVPPARVPRGGAPPKEAEGVAPKAGGKAPPKEAEGVAPEAEGKASPP